MIEDKIVEETRKIRKAYLAELNFDLDALYTDLKKKEKKSRKRLVRFSPRKPLSSPPGA